MLWFWVIVLVAIIGAIAVVAAGRGDSMSDVYDDRPDASLPTGRPLAAEDLRTLRLNTGVRGYRMDEVDALLERLQAEMLSREAEDVRVLSGRPAKPASGPAELANSAAQPATMQAPEATETTRIVERSTPSDEAAAEDTAGDSPDPSPGGGTDGT